jgi:hypothetical protein
MFIAPFFNKRHDESECLRSRKMDQDGSAVTLAILFFTDVITGTWGIVAIGGAGILFITALAGYCPMNALLGINTCSAKSHHH